MIDESAQIVGMGELKIGRKGDVLKATLGSCIGIAFLWKNGGHCGLAHCLLAEAPESGLPIGARYVSQAIPSLLKLMGARVRDYADIEVIIVGGARMFSVRQMSGHVGKSNADAAQKYLLQHGLTVKRSEIGGRRGRQIVIDCSGPSASVTEIVLQTGEHHYECP